MSKLKITFETTKHTEAQLRAYAAQNGVTITAVETIKPKLDLAGIGAKLGELATAAGREFKRMQDQVAQGAANPDAVTDAHVAQFRAALDTGLAQMTAAVADIKAMTEAK